MSYRIEYHPDTNHKFPTNTGKGRWNVWRIIVILAVILILGITAVKNEQVSAIIFPGDPELTRSALNGMLDDIRAGEPVKDAFSTFCLEIIENAQIDR